MSEENTITVKPLRKMLQRFNESLGEYINKEERYKLGRVLTIVDAAIADPEQRKAIKDLVNNEWWNSGAARLSDGGMDNPHTDIRAICNVLGFELYEPNASTLPSVAESTMDEYVAKKYQKISIED